ncbi:hypothetical protein KR222_007672 [Zaprionus bogoriensis]|nr:hypothetical protein KR222_007672 [Zaprionus bogoriensis]
MNIKISPENGATYAKWMSLGYGVASFGLVFIVEHLGGVLQATLTLNGLIGGVTLGLFVLGIVCKQANTKGAFYGGLLSLALVIFVGVVGQIGSVEIQALPTSVERCDCHVNVTGLIENLLTESLQPMEAESFTSWSIFRLSYMWFSMIGCLLTVFLGWAISLIVDGLQRRSVRRITCNGIHNSGQSAEVLRCETLVTSTTVKADDTTCAEGHVNLGIHLDDENDSK